ncbi:hypothetical protein K474DRAFT_284691 [Panus rudis PR-1116 ss-1]|nr:hypothetical protein K474DRAFT_1713652 [Panus rudis PR-1116 ss-1]KAI0072970.1 hypothetical protein K474DRAFT_284691 [Panus rudis PR-1116 ss-1]
MSQPQTPIAGTPPAAPNGTIGGTGVPPVAYNMPPMAYNGPPIAYNAQAHAAAQYFYAQATQGQGQPNFIPYQAQADPGLTALNANMNTPQVQVPQAQLPAGGTIGGLVGAPVMQDQGTSVIDAAGLAPLANQVAGGGTNVAVADPAPAQVAIGTPERRRPQKELARSTQATMLSMMGLKRPSSTTAQAQIILPHPLQRGEAPRVGNDGRELATPDFTGAVNDPVNMRFLEDVVSLMIRNETRARTLAAHVVVTERLVEVAAKQYFSTLRMWYRRQNEEATESKMRERRAKNTRRQRKKRKADNLRKAVPLFRAKYGEENTVGLEQIIHTDYQSSEHSDCGAADPAEFDAYRTAHGGGTDGLEIRREQWRSYKLDRIYYSLKTLVIEQTHNELKRGERPGKVQRLRFQGMKVNANNRMPPAKPSKRPYISCVSEDWAERTGNTSIPMLQDPEDFTIFSLEIPDEDLDKEDLAWLADDEGED